MLTHCLSQRLDIPSENEEDSQANRTNLGRNSIGMNLDMTTRAVVMIPSLLTQILEVLGQQLKVCNLPDN